MTEPPFYSLQKIASDTTDSRFVAAWRQNHPERYLGMLPLLEHELDNVVQDFPTALEAAGAAKEIRASFSVDDLVLYALGWHTQWGALAVAWLQQGAELNEKIVAAIDRAVAKKYWTQKDRHIAFRLARRWEREQI